ncbi:YtzC family protein [Niallia taxi]|uniref:YtzC family protein n=1 Tax=Niallia taxi TaxID=2499688 RepID=UPI003D27A07E
MATRDSIDELLERCNAAIGFAEEQYKISQMQQHYNIEEYTDAQFQLENVFNDLETMDHSANAQQRDQLYRMRLLIQDKQNQMALHLP